MRRPGTLAVAVAALAVAGCGGQSDKEKVETTVRDYFTAFADSDFDKACDKLAETTRDDLVKAARAKDCTTALDRITSASVHATDAARPLVCGRVQQVRGLAATVSGVPVRVGDLVRIGDDGL